MSNMNRIGDHKFLEVIIHKKESKFFKLKSLIKESLFYFFYLLLKDGHHLLYLECISIAYQYLQILYFPFDSYVNNFIIQSSLMLNGKKKTIFQNVVLL